MSTNRKARPSTPEKYLWEKPNARYLWFRIAVPTRYRDVERRRIIQCCLGTRDRQDASILAAQKRAELDAQWKAAVGEQPASLPMRDEVVSHVPTLIDLQIFAGGYAHDEVSRRLDDYRHSKGLGNAEELAKFVASIEAHRLRLVSTKGTAALPQWEIIADNAIVRRGWVLAKGGEDYRNFIGMIAEAVIEAFRVTVDKMMGNYSSQSTSAVVIAGRVGRAAEAKIGESISELFERYAAERAAEKSKRSDTISQDRKVIALFAEFVGKGRSLPSVTAANIRDWKAILSTLPPNYRKMTIFAGKDQREASIYAIKNGLGGLSPTTVNRHISAVSSLFKWARTNSYAEANPCDGLFFAKAKRPKSRPPFTPAQLNMVLMSPLFTGFERDGKEFRPGTRMSSDWRYWIPLIAMFTGARIGEIAQLRVGDVKRQHGAWFLHLRHDEVTAQITKSGQSRIAPIHSFLRNVGFLAFVRGQRIRAAIDGRPELFPDLERNDRDQIGAKPSRFWRWYLSAIGLKDGGDGIGAHSFRHSIADQLRAADYLDDEIEVVLGHNQKTVTSGYGMLAQGSVRRLSAMIEAVRFPGVNFEHLYVPSRKHPDGRGYASPTGAAGARTAVG